MPRRLYGSVQICETRELRSGSTKASCGAAMPGMPRSAGRSRPVRSLSPSSPRMRMHGSRDISVLRMEARDRPLAPYGSRSRLSCCRSPSTTHHRQTSAFRSAFGSSSGHACLPGEASPAFVSRVRNLLSPQPAQGALAAPHGSRRIGTPVPAAAAGLDPRVQVVEARVAGGVRGGAARHAGVSRAAMAGFLGAPTPSQRATSTNAPTSATAGRRVQSPAALRCAYCRSST